MWGNYGRILAEYIFIKNFRESIVFKTKCELVKGQEYFRRRLKDK